jgi:uncharacterized membrane protein YgcG
MDLGKRAAVGVLTATVLTAGLSGCGKDRPSYRPVAYGEAGTCFFVDDPYEVVQQQALGLCPTGWTPARMPPYWLNRYASYYDSPAYANAFVLPAHRTVYINTGKTYLRDHKADITAALKDAQYSKVNKKGQTVGQPVPATKIAKQVTSGKFGGGSARTTSQGGGGARTGSGSGSSTSVKSGGSSSSSFKSSGSARSIRSSSSRVSSGRTR